MKIKSSSEKSALEVILSISELKELGIESPLNVIDMKIIDCFNLSEAPYLLEIHIITSDPEHLVAGEKLRICSKGGEVGLTKTDKASSNYLLEDHGLFSFSNCGVFLSPPEDCASGYRCGVITLLSFGSRAEVIDVGGWSAYDYQLAASWSIATRRKFTYFASDQDNQSHIKVGVSKNPAQRIKAIRKNGNFKIDALIPDHRAEKEAISLLSGYAPSLSFGSEYFDLARKKLMPTAVSVARSVLDRRWELS